MTYCLAVDNEQKSKSVEHMLDLMHLDEAVKTGIKSCVKGSLEGPYSPTEYAKSKGSYYGFTPESPDWQNVIDAHKRFAAKSCNYFSVAEYRDWYREFYMARIDMESLRAWIDFMEGPHGLKFLRTQDEFVKEFGKIVTPLYQSNMAKAQEEMESELKQLSDRNGN